MAERLGYRHIRDFLTDQGSHELTGWFEYLRMDDEVQVNRLIYAIVKAFNGDKVTQKPVDNDEPVIDTTDPTFAEQFQGFTGAPGRQR